MVPLADFKPPRGQKLDNAPRANHGASLDELIDISVNSDKPVVIQNDKGKDIGVVDKPTLLKGIQGGKA
jgi:glycine betaine/proline transport system ATP-binding protein